MDVALLEVAELICFLNFSYIRLLYVYPANYV